MATEDGTNVWFKRVNLEGTNNGATMHVHRGDPGEPLDPCNINMYVSDNIQGVNSSILLGSEVAMGEPGVILSLGDVTWERATPERRDTNVNRDVGKFPLAFGFDAILMCVFVLAPSILFALFGR